MRMENRVWRWQHINRRTHLAGTTRLAFQHQKRHSPSPRPLPKEREATSRTRRTINMSLLTNGAVAEALAKWRLNQQSNDAEDFHEARSRMRAKNGLLSPTPLLQRKRGDDSSRERYYKHGAPDGAFAAAAARWDRAAISAFLSRGDEELSPRK